MGESRPVLLVLQYDFLLSVHPSSDTDQLMKFKTYLYVSEDPYSWTISVHNCLMKFKTYLYGLEDPYSWTISVHYCLMKFKTYLYALEDPYSWTQIIIVL